MEKFKPTPLTEVTGSLLELSRRLVGPDREAVKRIANQTLQTAHVTHGKETQKAQARETRFRRNRSTLLRSLTPTTGTTLLQTLNHMIELEEEETTRSPECKQPVLSPQIYRDRYSLALLNESLHNTLTAVVDMSMIQHGYRQREAREIFELVTQDRSSIKPDCKFYEKRTEVKEKLKNRFSKTDYFQLTPSEKEIETVVLSESEADDNYALLELSARLLGEPVFLAPFDPKQSIPALASNGRNFDEKNAVEHRRIQAVVSPRSFQSLVESLEYTNMKKIARGPVLKIMGTSGNGNNANNNGNHGTPLREDSEADATQDDINAIVNDYVDSIQFRRLLKLPKLEVVVDGTPMSAPFAATSAASRHFQLPGFAKFVQVFAIEKGRRSIVSSLSLPQTEVSLGKTWHSALELEGKQVISLTVEPAIDGSGKLASSSLLVGYQPRLTLFNIVVAALQGSWSRGKELWPSWMTKPIFASIVGVLGLAPFFMIDVFSLSAFFILMLSLTALLLLAGRISPTWRLVRPQQIAVDGFVALMLVTMLLLGILPPGSVSTPPIVPVATASPRGPGSSGARMTLAVQSSVPQLEGVTFGPTGATSYIWSVYGSKVRESDFDLSIWDHNYDPSQDYLVVRPPRSLIGWSPGSLQSANEEARVFSAAFQLQSRAFSPIWLESINNQRILERSRIGAPGAIAATPADKEVVAGAHAHGIKRRAVRNASLHDVFDVEVLVDTTEIIKLIRDHLTIATELATSAANNQKGTIGTPGSPGNVAVADAANQPASDIQPNGAEETKTTDPVATPTGAVAARKAAAWVVFESPTKLGSLNKGDVVNANFKPMLLSTGDPRGALLACTATGVVQDKRTSGTDVEVRVGLKLTWIHNGKPVNGNLDLLLTDCASDKENSHQGFLATPQDQIAEVAHIESRLRKP
jgi:hypothetical protein